MTTVQANPFGEVLRGYRQAAGLTQEELAERAGLSARAVSYLERGTRLPYRDTVQRLAAALALEPEGRAALEAARRAGERAAALRETAPRNPYKGLRAFARADADDFFGRDRLVDALLRRLDAVAAGPPRFVGVVGASGAGKSSLVLAGLLPRLQAGLLAGSAAWPILGPVLPGARPIDALIGALGAARPDLPADTARAALADVTSLSRLVAPIAPVDGPPPARRVVLVVDQAEEVFTLADDEGERRQFIDLLVDAATRPDGPLLIILTLRADLYDRPLGYPALGALLGAGSAVVLPPDADDLRAAIEGPAALPDVGVRFEEGLVADMLLDVHDQAGALPLLQFTLDALFARRDGRVLTRAAYRALGGVRGALAGHAEATYAALPDEGSRDLARALFVRLVEPGSSERDLARRRTPLADLRLSDVGGSARLRAVADHFVRARLLVASEAEGAATIEVAHEALIREWARLAAWLHEARADIRLRHTINADAGTWIRHGRPADALYRGLVLDEALDWAARNTASTEETAFLHAARAERQRREAEEHERRERELTLARAAAAANRRAAVRLRTLAGTLALFLLVAAGLAAVAVRNATTAREERARAVAERTLALSRALAAQAVAHLDDRYDLALVLGVQARRVADTADARSSLLAAVEARPAGLRAFLQGHERDIAGLALTPDGTVLASGSVDGVVRLWDLAHRRPRGPPLLHGGAAVTALSLSPDGRLLAVGQVDGTIRLWDVARRRPVGRTLRDDTSGLTSLAFSPDGTTLASGNTDGAIQFWSLARQRLQGPAMDEFGPNTSINSIAFSPDGTTLASTDNGGLVQLWNVATRLPRGLPLAALDGAATCVAFSPHGTVLAFAGVDTAVRLWDLARHRLLGALPGHSAAVNALAFSRDGRTLASGGADQTVRLWDVARQRPLGPPLSSHTGAVESVVFGAGGGTLIVGTQDGAIALWDLRRRGADQDRLDQTGAVGSVAFSPDGTTLAAGGRDGLVRLWDVARRRPRGGPLAGLGAISSLAFSPDGTTLAAGSSAGVEVWAVARAPVLESTVGSGGSAALSVAFSPDGHTLAIGGGDGAVRLWGAGGRAPRASVLTGHTKPVLGVAFRPDGRVLASGSADGTIRLWDVIRGRTLGPPLHAGFGRVWSVAFSRDGRLIAAGTDDTVVQLWDVARRALLAPPLLGHTSGVDAVAFSPDGRALASVGWDLAVRLWDVASRQPLGLPLRGHTARITSVAFSPDGRLVASGSWDGSVRLWPVDVSVACRIANRTLTLQEWRQYLGDEPYRPACLALR